MQGAVGRLRDAGILDVREGGGRFTANQYRITTPQMVQGLPDSIAESTPVDNSVESAHNPADGAGFIAGNPADRAQNPADRAGFILKEEKPSYAYARVGLGPVVDNSHLGRYVALVGVPVSERDTQRLRDLTGPVDEFEATVRVFIETDGWNPRNVPAVVSHYRRRLNIIRESESAVPAGAKCYTCPKAATVKAWGEAYCRTCHQRHQARIDARRR